MQNRQATNRRWLLGVVLVVNGLLFLGIWYAALRWQSRGSLIGLALAGTAAGLTLGQYLAFALWVAFHLSPSPRHWLWAVACLAVGSVTFCGLQLFFDPWVEDRDSLLRVLLARQIPALLSLTAVGIFMLLLLRLAIWPVRRFAGPWLALTRERPDGEARQYTLAEFFLVTAGVAAACWLGRSLFDASLSAPLVQGAALFLGALPTALFMIAVSRLPTLRRRLGLACLWVVVVSVLLMPLVAVANEYLDLLAPWTGWRPLNTWSVETLITAAAFTIAASIAARANWGALRSLRRRSQISLSTPTIASAARLTPPAAPR